MSRYFLTHLLAASTIAFCAAVPAAQASAIEVTPSASTLSASASESDQEELSAFLSEWGVDVATQQSLMMKLESGIPWDSMTEQDPVSTEDHSTVSQTITVKRYADGSVSVASVDLPRPPVQDTAFRSVSGCVTKSSNHYESVQTGCHAYASVGVLSMGFYFDRVSNPGVPGRITNYYGHHHASVMSTMSNHRLEKFSDQIVRYSADWNLVNKFFPVGNTTWVQVTLGNGLSAWTNHYM